MYELLDFLIENYNLAVFTAADNIYAKYVTDYI